VTAQVTSFAASFQALDTPTVDMTLVGAGTLADPFVLSATSAIGMQQLSDVDDPAGPGLGEVPVWNGVAFEFAAPPTVAPGAVNAGAGLDGDGSFGDPLKVAVSDAVSTTTSGLGIYVDTNGQLRAVTPPAGLVTWADVQGKPTTFPPTIGTTSTTAKAGDWFPTWGQVTGKPTTSTLDGRTIYQGTTAPAAGLGVNSDIYLMYT
jgi:hypothetical protein